MVSKGERVRNSLAVQGPGVRSLVGELRSHKPKKKKREIAANQFNYRSGRSEPTLGKE